MKRDVLLRSNNKFTQAIVTTKSVGVNQYRFIEIILRNYSDYIGLKNDKPTVAKQKTAESFLLE